MKNWFGPNVLEFIQAKVANDKEALESVRKKTVEQILKVLGKIAENADRSIKWKVINPGTQATGSFNPIFEPASAFYNNHENYWPIFVGLTPEMLFLVKQIIKGNSFSSFLFISVHHSILFHSILFYFIFPY